MDNPLRPACLKLLEEMKGKSIPMTLNFPEEDGVVFVYSGDNWELFSNAIRQAVDKVQEALLEGMNR